jgi:positive regulator of sigma E activity
VALEFSQLYLRKFHAMIQEAEIIREIETGIYEIQLYNENQHCSSCSLLSDCAGQTCRMLAVSEGARFEAGTKVKVEIKEKNEVFRVFLVLLFPLLCGLVAALLFDKLGNFGGLMTFAGFVGGFLLAFIPAAGYERKAKKVLPRVISLGD